MVRETPSNTRANDMHGQTGTQPDTAPEPARFGGVPGAMLHDAPAKKGRIDFKGRVNRKFLIAAPLASG
jgi:hypothetical protein